MHAAMNVAENRTLIPEPVRVLKTKKENSDTVTLELSLPRPSYSWLPGQFNMLYVFGRGEIPVSMSGDPSNRATITHTIRAVGAVSDWFLSAKTDDVVWLRGPYGSAWPLGDPLLAASSCDTEDMLILAGGLGLAPLRPVVLSALRRAGQGRTLLLFGARSLDDLLFRDDFAEWKSARGMTFKLALGRPFDHAMLGVPFAAQDVALGFVNQFLPQLELTPERTRVFCCGPEVMMRHLAAELVHRGVSAHRIFLSMERNMKCAIGVCGRCQWGAHFICQDGPVYPYATVEQLLRLKEY